MRSFHEPARFVIMANNDDQANSMIKKEPTISPAELKVLEILWKSSPLSSSQIIDALKNTESWHNQTVKTLLSRLVSKKVISYKQESNRYLYIPLLKKRDYQKAISYSFIKRVFGGKISPLLAYFSKQEKISKEEIKELKAIINELEAND